MVIPASVMRPNFSQVLFADYTSGSVTRPRADAARGSRKGGSRNRYRRIQERWIQSGRTGSLQRKLQRFSVFHLRSYPLRKTKGRFPFLLCSVTWLFHKLSGSKDSIAFTKSCAGGHPVHPAARSKQDADIAACPEVHFGRWPCSSRRQFCSGSPVDNLLKRPLHPPGIGAPVESRTASWGIFTRPDSTDNRMITYLTSSRAWKTDENPSSSLKPRVTIRWKRSRGRQPCVGYQPSMLKERLAVGDIPWSLDRKACPRRSNRAWPTTKAQRSS